MFSQKIRRVVAGAAVSATIAGAAIAASPAMAWSPAPCSWTGSRIQCSGAVMSGQGRSGNIASADAKYAGGVLYQVGCTISTNTCNWQRIY